jgi:hypothetical protein
MPLVFQYGSNADTTEINSANRLAGRAVDRGRAQTVDEFEIAFRGGHLSAVAWSKFENGNSGRVVR